MMFVMQSHVIGKPVQRAVIRKSFRDRDFVFRVASFRRDLFVDVVLCDEVPRCGMKGAGEETAEKEIKKGVKREKRVREEKDEGVVDTELDEQVEPVYPSEGDAVDGHGPQGIKEDLEGAEEGFAEDGVEKEGLEGGGKVRVETVDAEGFVVG